MNTTQFQPIINFIWGVADDLLRDIYVKGKYRDIILPMTIIRRIDAVLQPTKQKVIETYNKYKDKLENLEDMLGGENGSGLKFYNYSSFTLDSLCNDPKNIRANFENYLDSFSPNMQDIISKFKFKNQLDTLEEANILFQVIERFCSPKINFSINPILDSKGNIIHDGLSNLGMGYVFEELIRKFNEENNEEAGEHFTPREIIELMTHLVFLPIKDKIQEGVFLIYDNACGSGGMLTESKEFVTSKQYPIKSNATFYLYGQEINPETYAICKADMLIKGENPDRIKYGSTLNKNEDGFSNINFDFMLTNPPYGKSWGQEQQKAKDDPRFQIGITSKNDGQMMFLLNMISKMKHDTELGSRIASVHNGSSLFNSDSGQVAIRKHIIENDYLEAIIALPTNMFYNTGIPTFIWIITNRKPEHKKGKVQLINASSQEYYIKLKKSLGQKQNQMTNKHIELITDLFLDYKATNDCLILDNTDFGYTKITIEKPKSIETLENNEKFLSLENKNIILEKLKALETTPKDFKDRKEFLIYIGIKLNKSQENLLIDKSNEEKIPLKTDIQSYYNNDIKPYVPNSWIDWNSKAIGYEILFNKYFYTYTPPRSLESISKDLKRLEQETQDLLREIL